MRRAEVSEHLLATRLERSLHEISPDPLFRRRLRGSILNDYVAQREGLVRRATRPRRQMGVLGRSVLYASVAIALGVTAVGAASQGALPGDPLYGVKLRLEEIRWQIAPASVRDDLAAVALAERTRELQQLVANGSWSQVPAAAERITAAEGALSSIEPDAALAPATSNAQQVLETVIERAPEAALPGLQQALEATGGADSRGHGQGVPATKAQGSGTDRGASPSAHPEPSLPPQANGKGRPTKNGS